MTPENLKALATLDGWTEITTMPYAPNDILFGIPIGLKGHFVLPSYDDSYDAIIPLIQKLKQCDMLDWETDWKETNPEKLCEELLRELNLWTE